jgi:ribonuclease HI
MVLNIFTDGSFWWENNSTGGWAAVFVARKDDEKVVKYISGYEENTTSNRMEILAVIEAVKVLQKSPAIFSSANIYSDSQYTVRTINEWLDNWIRKGKTRKNMDLWAIYLSEREKVTVPLRFHWIKGHAGHEYNEMADKFAAEARLHKLNNSRLTNI